MLPFSAGQLFAVFASYNDAIWPAQLVGYGRGAAASALLFRPVWGRQRAHGEARGYQVSAACSPGAEA